MRSEAEINDDTMAWWKSLPAGTVIDTDAKKFEYDQRPAAKKRLELLERHGFVEKVDGGYVTRQMSILPS